MKRVRFATKEELFESCELVSGSVPPFGEPVLPFQLYLDKDFSETSTRIAFNAGLLTRSIILGMSDYLRVANPIILDFADESKAE